MGFRRRVMNMIGINTVIMTGVITAIIALICLWYRQEVRMTKQEEEYERWVNESRC